MALLCSQTQAKNSSTEISSAVQIQWCYLAAKLRRNNKVSNLIYFEKSVNTTFDYTHLQWFNC